MGYPIYHSQYTAAQIEAAIGKGPRVNASGFWEVWNVSTGAYESTGVGAGVTPPTVVTQVSQMTNHGYVYIYNGSETGYTAGYWYYWDGSAWTAGGAYQVAATDPTLSITGAAADAKATGDKLGELKSALSDLQQEVMIFPPISLTWENGLFTANGYEELPSTTVTFKRSQILPSGEYIVTPSENIRWEAFYYVSDTQGTLMFSLSTNERRFVATSPFIITIGKVGGGSLDGMESNIQAFSVKSKNYELLSVKDICSKSFDIKIERFNNIEYIDRMNYSSLDKGTATNVVSDNSIRFQNEPESIKVVTNASRSNSEIRVDYANSFTLLGTQEFEVCVYIKDITKITEMRISVPTASMVKSYSGLINGWNKIRFLTEGAGAWDESAANTQIRLMFYHPSGTEETVYIGKITEVKPNYANLILVADGPYYSVYDKAYPRLKSLGVPIVWALDAEQLDANEATTRKLINMNELNVLAFDGLSEFSFHNYNGTIMSTASKEEALADTLNSIRFLNKNGIQPSHIWRAAWLQNNCPNHSLADLEVEASACYDGSTGVTPYPFVNKFNIARMGVAGRTESWFDGIFNKLKNQHCTAVLYFHGVSNGERDITETMLTYLIDTIETAIGDGYLNPTTYTRLVNYYSET